MVPRLCQILVFGLLPLLSVPVRGADRAPAAADAPPPEVEVRSFPAPREPERNRDRPRDERRRITAEDLRRVETRVREHLPRLMAATVGVSRRNGEEGGQGSGVIVSAEGLVLTAAHVSGTPGLELSVSLADGRTVKAKALGRNRTDDSGMLQILDEGPFPFVERGASDSLDRGEWVIALGHPGGWRRDRAAVLRVGRVNQVGTWVLSDAVLVGGDSGGPLFDLDGKLVGIHSRIMNSASANMHVPIDKFAPDWDRLAAGEEWNELRGLSRALAGAPWLGIEIEPADGDAGQQLGLRVTLVEQSGPAAAAGLMAGDVITRFNNKAVKDRGDLATMIQKLSVGDTAQLDVVRDGGEEATLRVRLARRPATADR